MKTTGKQLKNCDIKTGNSVTDWSKNAEMYQIKRELCYIKYLQMESQKYQFYGS